MRVATGQFSAGPHLPTEAAGRLTMARISPRNSGYRRTFYEPGKTGYSPTDDPDGIPMIDVFNSLVESQKIPIFSLRVSRTMNCWHGSRSR
jgi:hypothetical protein